MKIRLKAVLILVLCVLSVTLLSACNKDAAASDKPTLYPYDPGDAFTTNIKDSPKMRMLKCKIVFRLTDEKSVESFAVDNDIIRDAVNKVLLNLTEDEVLTNPDLDAIGARLVEAANTAMGTTYFYSVSFTDFAAA